MPLMIPNKWKELTPKSSQLYKALSNQLDRDFRVVQYLDKLTDDVISSNIFWIQYKKQSLFLYLSTSLQLNLNQSSQEKLLENTEISTLLKLQNQLLPKQLRPYKAKLAPFLVLIPQHSKSQNQIVMKSLGLFVLGDSIFKADNFGDVIYKLLGEANSVITQNHIRYNFNPEVILSSLCHPAPKLSSLQENLLDEEQEAALKSGLFSELPKKGIKEKNNKQEYEINLTSINGNTASGKSETLLKRVQLIRQQYPESNTLVISINKSTHNSLKNRYLTLMPNDSKTDLFYMFQWCNHLLKSSKKLVSTDDIEDIINPLITPILEKEGISFSSFLQELTFIYGRKIYYEKDYLEAIESFYKHSNLLNLKEEQCPYIWKAYLLFKNELSNRKWNIWQALPQQLWDAFQNHAPITSYDHILIDDAQYLSPLALDLLKIVLKPTTGKLFITNNLDYSQNTSAFSDEEINLNTDIHEHKFQLTQHYKINPVIIRATNSFKLKRTSNKQNDDVACLITKTDHVQSNTMPKLLHFHSLKDEVNRLLNEVKKKIQEGATLNEILIITPNNKTTQKVANIIKTTLHKQTHIIGEGISALRQEDNNICVCNIDQAKGFAYAHVFIINLHHLFSSEDQLNDKTKDDKKYQELVTANTQLITTAMTRARQTLTLFITTDLIPEAFINPYFDIPTANKNNNANISYLQQTA